MALAIIRHKFQDGENHIFNFDIGTNRYYYFIIGKNIMRVKDYYSTIEDPSFKSPVKKMSSNNISGSGEIKVPVHLFNNRDCNKIQLISCKDSSGIGTTYSDVVRVITTSGSLSTENFNVNKHNEMTYNRTENVPFNIKEVKHSEAMFLSSIMPFVSKALPAIGGLMGSSGKGGAGGIMNMVGSVLGGLSGGGSSGGSAAPVAPTVSSGGGGSDIFELISKFLEDPKTLELIQQLIAMLTGKSTAASISAPAQFSTMSSTKYSEAKIAPAVLAALIPLAEKLANPETINAINAPIQNVTNAATGIFRDFFGLNENMDAPEFDDLQIHKLLSETGAMQNQLMAQIINNRHKEAMAQSVNLKTQNKYLQFSFPKEAIEFKKIKSVKLIPADGDQNDNSAYCYSKNNSLKYPVTVETPKSISKGKVVITLKSLDKLNVIYKKAYKVENVNNGDLSVIPSIPSEVLSTVNADNYLLSIKLLWKSKQNEILGTATSQIIELVNKFKFENILEIQNVVPLNDIDIHRDYWHKIWADSTTQESNEINFDCKYYSVLEQGKSNNARMESVYQTEQFKNREQSVKLKSGLVMSAEKLNDLIPTISEYPKLSEEHLNAICRPGIIRKFNRLSRSKVTFNNRPGDSIALWVFPEIAFSKISLKKVENTNNNGRVTSFSDEEIYFPVPRSYHFIGTRIT